jgi:hypothetical protein
MKSIALTAAVLIGAAFATIAPAQADTIYNAYDRYTLYSDATVGCVASDARTRLTAGQYAYLESLLDRDLTNSLPTARANGLSVGDVVRVHGFVWTAGPACVLRR